MQKNKSEPQHEFALPALRVSRAYHAAMDLLTQRLSDAGHTRAEVVSIVTEILYAAINELQMGAHRIGYLCPECETYMPFGSIESSKRCPNGHYLDWRPGVPLVISYDPFTGDAK